ncbi:MAG: lipase family protein [Pseudanabaena sp.]|jgi:triacylglycerol lipase
MISVKKIQIPEGTGFDRKVAMELANLISVAYNEYEVWDSNEELQHENELPPVITGSQDFADLEMDSIECHKQNGENRNTDFEKLNPFWATSKTYTRCANFFFPQWWWLEALEPDNLPNLLEVDIQNFWNKLKDIVTTDQIFGFIAQSQKNPNQLFVVFRGTREGAEWFNNFRPKPKTFLPNDFSDLGDVRNGFNLIYTIDRPKNPLLEFLKNLPLFSKFFANQNTISSKEVVSNFFSKYFLDKEKSSNSEIFITGHSLGAGLATLAALHIAKLAERHKVNPSIKLYTFASPRVGDETFAGHFDDFEKIKSYRIINSEDLIQAVPFPTTEVVDAATERGMSVSAKMRLDGIKQFLDKFTQGQAKKHYQHVGLSVTFTQQTGKIAGNHNLTDTYRRALFNDI